MDFLSRSQKILTHAKQNFTAPRQKILHFFAKNPRPHTIAQLAPQLSIDRATLYRNCQLFSQLGILHQLHGLGAFLPCSQQKTQQHCHHLAICPSCQNFSEFSNDNTHAHPEIPAAFATDAQIFELVTPCRHCSHDSPSPKK